MLESAKRENPDDPSTKIKLEPPSTLECGDDPLADAADNGARAAVEKSHALAPPPPPTPSLKCQPPPPPLKPEVKSVVAMSPAAAAAAAAHGGATVGFKLLPTNKFHGAVLQAIPEGWIRKVVINEAGFHQQKVFYYNKNGKKFSSAKEIDQYFHKLGYSAVKANLFDFHPAAGTRGPAGQHGQLGTKSPRKKMKIEAAAAAVPPPQPPPPPPDSALEQPVSSTCSPKPPLMSTVCESHSTSSEKLVNCISSTTSQN